MEMLVWVAAGLGAIILGYVIVNGRRNSDPHNRKCAAEVCEYLAEAAQPNVSEVHAIFMSNARYRAQAFHVVSMVPLLLMKAGYSEEIAMSHLPTLRAAASLVPR